MKDRYLNIHFRLYDKDLIEMTEKILDLSPEFSSKEDLYKKIAKKEIQRIYEELCDYDKKENKIDEADLTVRIDQCYIMLSIAVKLLSAILNIETDKLSGNKVDPENITNGLYDGLPKRFQKYLENLFTN